MPLLSFILQSFYAIIISRKELQEVMNMNVRSRIISINLIEKIKLQPEYAEKIGINLRYITSNEQNSLTEEVKRCPQEKSEAIAV